MRKGEKVASVLICAVFAVALFATAAMAAEGKDYSIMDAKYTDWHVGAGYFLPNEGDFDATYNVDFGLEYTEGKDTIFFDFMYAQTSPNVVVTFGDCNNYIYQAGYMTNFNKMPKTRVGVGLQVHQIELGSAKGTKMTIVGVGEQDFGKRWTARIQMSPAEKLNGVKFGGANLMLLYNFN